jgi:hypothetical protein
VAALPAKCPSERSCGAVRRASLSCCFCVSCVRRSRAALPYSAIAAGGAPEVPRHNPLPLARRLHCRNQNLQQRKRYHCSRRERASLRREPATGLGPPSPLSVLGSTGRRGFKEREGCTVQTSITLAVVTGETSPLATDVLENNGRAVISSEIGRTADATFGKRTRDSWGGASPPSRGRRRSTQGVRGVACRDAPPADPERQRA